MCVWGWVGGWVGEYVMRLQHCHIIVITHKNITVTDNYKTVSPARYNIGVRL